MEYAPESITWIVLPLAHACFNKVRLQVDAEEYEKDKAALKRFLCGYFSTGDCGHKQGKSIVPMKSSNTAAHGKALKVRWAYPGCGKSGGLRLAVVAYCDSRIVKIAGAWQRADDPNDDDFFAATKLA
jgi:hypothetical protein